jgi:hypothetical protein
MSILGSALVAMYPGKKKLKNMGRNYYLDILEATTDKSRADWDKLSDNTLKIIALKKKKEFENKA